MTTSSAGRNGDVNSTAAVTIEGTPEFHSKTKKLLAKDEKRFRTTLMKEAARLEAFDLELTQDADWNTSKANKCAPRLQSKTKRDATDEFIKNALEAGVIEPSQSEHWSQVLLTPKPNGKWRFCVDYRHLNKNTKSNLFCL